MAAFSDIFCGPCEAQHLTKCADHWCPECEEGLCSVCQKHHSASKATRKHKIIAIDCYKQIPTFISEIADTCQEHEIKYNMYCPHHDAICCPLCITMDHSKCTDLKAISEITKNAKSSTLFSSMEIKLREILTFLDTVVKNINVNQSSITQKRLKLKNEMRQLRCKINAHLDLLEENMSKALDDAEKKASAHLENVKTQMCVKTEKCEKLLQGLMAIKEHASDIQAFYGGRKIKLEVEKDEQILQSMSKGEILKEKHIDGRIDDNMSSVLSMTTFGSITTNTGPSLGLFTPVKDILGEIMSVTYLSSSKPIENIKLTLQSTISIAKGHAFYISCCLICPNGKLCFGDWINKYIVMFTSDGSLNGELKLSSGPNDVTLIDNTTTAVSTDIGIQVIDIDNLVLKRDVKTSSWCFGISYYNGFLYWCENFNEIKKMELSTGKISTVLQLSLLPDPFYITIYKDKIYRTYRYAVTCCTLQGETEWKFELDSDEEDSKRITIDNDSNVYVISYNGSSVVVISPDGKRSRQLLSEKDGLNKPTGIYFDKTGNILLISNRQKNALAFQFHR